MLEFIIIKIDSPEWNYIWEYVENHPINENIENKSIALNNKQAWQYVGSYKQKDKTIHQVRHRNHPRTNKLEYLTIKNSISFNDSDIQTKSLF